jgi:hypothetical protein
MSALLKTLYNLLKLHDVYGTCNNMIIEVYAPEFTSPNETKMTMKSMIGLLSNFGFTFHQEPLAPFLHVSVVHKGDTVLAVYRKNIEILIIEATPFYAELQERLSERNFSYTLSYSRMSALPVYTVTSSLSGDLLTMFSDIENTLAVGNASAKIVINKVSSGVYNVSLDFGIN